MTGPMMEQEDCWIPVLPPYASAPAPVRGVDPVTLRSVVGAIRRAEAIEVKYQSLSSPEPRWRWMAPHAIAFDGFRWHARAFCQNDQVFKDFLLSRIVEIGAQGPITADPQADTDWNSEVVLEIGPHPELSPTQRRAIEMDYGMEDGRAQIAVRPPPASRFQDHARGWDYLGRTPDSVELPLTSAARAD